MKQPLTLTSTPTGNLESPAYKACFSLWQDLTTGTVITLSLGESVSLNPAVTALTTVPTPYKHRFEYFPQCKYSCDEELKQIDAESVVYDPATHCNQTIFSSFEKHYIITVVTTLFCVNKLSLYCPYIHKMVAS